MAVVVAQQNSVETLTSVQLGRIFKAETRKWADGKNIVLVFHYYSAGETTTLEHLNRMSAAQLQAWMREHKDQIRLVGSDQDVLAVIESTPNAVGLVDVRSLNNRVKVVRIDGKLPLEAGYLPH
ncbi:MAG TPA: hypothetical protein VFB00_05360 [Terriglobales bacterium]|nr:hypothetical protein [Terriglobales bacterium]